MMIHINFFLHFKKYDIKNTNCANIKIYNQPAEPEPSSLAVAGAVAIACFILSKSYDKIVVDREGTTMTFLKNQKSVDKNVF